MLQEKQDICTFRRVSVDLLVLQFNILLEYLTQEGSPTREEIARTLPHMSTTMFRLVYFIFNLQVKNKVNNYCLCLVHT